MAVTIKDVAREAGVSFSTVSKVINKSPSISQATIDNVRAVMKRLNYHPNIRARNFAKKSTHNILFLFKIEKDIAFTSPHLFEIMCGIQQSLAKNKYSMSISSINDDENSIEELKNIISEQSTDAIIIHGSVFTKKISYFLKQCDMPHLVIGKPSFETTISWVDTNNILSGEIAVNFLTEHKYKNIAFIGTEDVDWIGTSRFKGVKEAGKFAGIKLDPDFVKHGNSSKESGYRSMNEILQLDKKPDSVICANNYIALGVVKALNENNIKIPDDIGVISFDDYPYSRIIDPMITVVDVNMFDMGLQIGGIIVRMIKNPTFKTQAYSTLPILIERQSTK